MMDAIQRAVPVPQAEVIMHGASGRINRLGMRAPLDDRRVLRMYITSVDHLADSDAPFAAAGLARRDQRLDMRPFRIGQVARITQFVAVVARAVVGSPRGDTLQEQIHHPRESEQLHLQNGSSASWRAPDTPPTGCSSIRPASKFIAAPATDT